MTTIDRIIELKAERNLTSKEVEIGAGLANSSISQWMRGKGKPSLENIIKLARYFEVSADYLLCLSEKKSINDIETSLSEEDQILLSCYHGASAFDRFRIIQLCMNINEEQNKALQNEKSGHAL